jgi:hypothetical protein
MELFGIEIRRKAKIKTPEEVIPDLKSFAPKDDPDGSLEVQASPIGGIVGQAYTSSSTARNDQALINKYRQIAQQPEASLAIDDVVHDAVVMDDEKPPVVLSLDRVEEKNISKKVKDKIIKEFDAILRLMQFRNKGADIFRRWYVDGRIYYHMIVDDKDISKGIQEMRPIDPRNIRKIREEIKQPNPKTGVDEVVGKREFYVYSPGSNVVQQGGPTQGQAMRGVQIDPNVIDYVHSGLIDNLSNLVIGYLHKAIKTYNQLSQVEDSVVIYRLARAPERRVFYIDVGNLPKIKAEEYVKQLMNRYRNKVIYDANTGQLASDRRQMHMLEDFWLPRREGGKGTQIDTLPGGQTLGNLEDVEYFQKKFYKSLHVPESRITSDSGFNLGRSSEITRDELKFSKFINKLRVKFSEVFSVALRYQLLCKNIITEEDWEKYLKEEVDYVFTNDSQFEMLKNLEIITEQANVLGQLDPYIGRFYSEEWIKRHVLHMDDRAIEEMEQQIDDENDEREDEGKPPLDQVTSLGGTYGMDQDNFDAIQQNVATAPGEEPPAEQEPQGQKGDSE